MLLTLLSKRDLKLLSYYNMVR